MLRAGYGIYFDTLGVDKFIPIQTGFSQATPIQPTLDSGVTYVADVSNPFPNGLLAPLGPAGGLATNLGPGHTGLRPEPRARVFAAVVARTATFAARASSCWM